MQHTLTLGFDWQVVEFCGPTKIYSYPPRGISFDIVNFLFWVHFEIHLFSNSMFRVKHRAHRLKLAFHHHAPAYLDEDYPIEIEVTNTDTRDLQVIISFLLQPPEIDDASVLLFSLVYMAFN